MQRPLALTLALARTPISATRHIATSATAFTHAQRLHSARSTIVPVAVKPTSAGITARRSMSTSASPVLSVQSPMAPLDRITEQNAVFFLCDIQETFRGKIIGYDGIIATALFLAKASNALGIPCVTTEQRPFKPTVAELSAAIAPADHPNHSLFTKSLFSMLTPEVSAALAAGSNAARRHVVLFGIEAHVCVLQTALDLLRQGFHVHVVVDGVGSQNQVDRDAALARFAAEAARSGSATAEAAGAGVLHLTTAESVLFEILRDAQHPQFKALVPVMKELAKAKQGGVAPSAAQGAAKL